MEVKAKAVTFAHAIMGGCSEELVFAFSGNRSSKGHFTHRVQKEGGLSTALLQGLAKCLSTCSGSWHGTVLTKKAGNVGQDSRAWELH